MKIDRVSNSNYKHFEQKNARHYNANFTGGYTEQITNGLHHANTIRKMESLKWLKGEIGGILITALGTGLVAPIFIGFNPFVKAPKNATPEEKQENKNTKLYTAMRQPISAVLAILFQASVQKYIDKGLDKVFNDPELAKYARVNLDQSTINTESRVKDIVKKEMRAENKTKPMWIKTLFSSEAKDARKTYKKDFEARVDELKDKQVTEVATQFEKDGFIHTKSGRTMDHKTVAELVNNQIDDYIKDARTLQKSADERIPYYLDRADVLINNKEKLNEMFKNYKSSDKITDDIINRLIAQNKNEPEIQKLLQEIKAKPEDLRAHRMERTLDRIKSIEKICGGTYSRETYRTKLIERNNVLEDTISKLSEIRIANPEAADEKTITSTIKKIAKTCDFSDHPDLNKQILKHTDTFSDNLEELTTKIFKDVAKKYKKLVENHYKSWNQVTKIGIGVFITLPITCTALNWVYPRFMEIFFPKLAGVKKQASQKKIGGDK